MADDEGRLRRWARRKTEAREKPAAEGEGVTRQGDVLAAVPPVSAGALRETEELPRTEPTDESGEKTPGADVDDGAGPEAVDVEDLPDIESLGRDSDYTGFMREGVPEKLRNMALRKLWLSDPAFAHIDGMMEYGEDFTDAATVVEGMKSIYEVGKGYITEEDEEKDEEEDGEETAEDEGVADTANPAEETERDDASEQASLASREADAAGLQPNEIEAESSEADGARRDKNHAGVGAKT